MIYSLVNLTMKIYTITENNKKEKSDYQIDKTMSERSKVWNPWMEGIEIRNWFSGLFPENGWKGERSEEGFRKQMREE